MNNDLSTSIALDDDTLDDLFINEVMMMKSISKLYHIVYLFYWL
jgi:hypothetical protein